MKNKGFTLIELLIVLAIVGLLTAIVLVNLNNSKQAARDTKRVADIREIMTALQLYYNDNSGYPGPAVPSATGPTRDQGDPDWSTYLIIWPTAPTPPDNPDGVTDCDSTTNPYTYTQLDGGEDYSVTFCLGEHVGQYAAGVHTASSEGID